MKLLNEDKGKRIYVDSTNHHFYEVPIQVRAQTVTFETKRDFRIDPVILSGMHDQAERMLGEWFSKRGEGGKMGATSEGELSFRTTRVRHWELDEDGNETGKLLYFVKVTAEQAFWPPEPVDPTGEEPPLPRPSDFIGDHLKADANDKTTDTEE